MTIVWGRIRDSVEVHATGPSGTYSVTGTAEHGYQSTPPYPPYPNTATGGQKVTTTCDFVHPQYKTRVKNGEIINSPFLRTVVDERLALPGAVWHEYAEQTPSFVCNLHSPSQTHRRLFATAGLWRRSRPNYLDIESGVRSGLRQGVIDLAVTAAHANIDTSELLAMATIAESSKTVQSMRDILFRAYKIMKKARRLELRALARELKPKELADRWMEARYAVRPLIYDAKGIAEAIAKPREFNVRKTFRGGAEDSTSVTQTLLNQSNGMWQTVTDWNLTSTYEVSARSGVLCDVDITDLSVWGADKSVEVLWELAPWSFVADWFANTGDWIAAHTPNAGVRQRASWVTVKSTFTKTRTAVADRSTVQNAGYNPVQLILPAQQDVWQESVLERIVDPALSTFPSSKMNLDVFKITDLSIMLRNIFSH